ncbi:MAG: transglutaminase-like domain-containing protein [Bacteriovorax sp.]|nr:transglutaminase-like domain-containing protein [Bacteriovorax sp.]
MKKNYLKYKRYVSTIIYLFLINYSHLVLARPADESLYSLNANHFHEISSEAIVEGSAQVGGLQPDYIADYENPAFDPIREYAHEIKKSDLPSKDKIENITNFIAKNILKNKGYNGKEYLNLMKQYKDAGLNIPLSEYIRISSGVCREHALITHYALKEAGISNSYLYVTVQTQKGVEDHAINIVDYKDEKWIVDSYNKKYNGLKLDEALKGVENPKDELFGHLSDAKFRKIIKINAYPAVWLPRSEFKNKIPPTVYLKPANKNTVQDYCTMLFSKLF